MLRLRRLILPLVACLAALGCGRREEHIEPGPDAPSSSPATASPSSPVPAPPPPAAEAPLVEREDIPLGKACRFQLSRPGKGAHWLLVDPEWERRKGQRFVTCHFALSPALPPVRVEVVTTPGADSMESLSIHLAGDDASTTVLNDSLTLLGWGEWEIEAIDVNFDGVKDLVMPWSRGSSGCKHYHYLVYVPGTFGGPPSRFVDSNVKEVCNPSLDPKRKHVLTESTDGEGIVRWRWDGYDFVRAR